MKLLEIELRKLIPYRSFWVAVLAYAILMPALFISLYRFNIKIEQFTLGFNFYNFPDVWHNTTYIASWFNILLYFFVILVVTNEYQFRTVRQNVIDGLSRWQTIVSKLLLILLFAIGSTLIVATIALLCGLFLSEEGSGTLSFEKAEFLGFYFVQLFGYMSFALLVATLLRKQAMSIIAFLAYILVAEPVLHYRFLPEAWAPYLPLEALGSLLPNPLPAYFGMKPPAVADPSLFWLSGIYIVIFIVGSGLVLQQRDI